MGQAIIRIKIMPESPDTNLGEIEKQAESVIQEEKGENTQFEREPVAFGLNAVIATFTRDETQDTDELVNKLKNIEKVNSAEIIDFRRAIG